MASVKANRDRDGKTTFTVYFRVSGKSRERTFKTERAAKDFRASTEAGQRAGTFVDPRAGSIPFLAYAEGWLTRAQLADRTRHGYALTITNPAVSGWIGGRTLGAVAKDRQGFKALMVSLKDAGKSTSWLGQVCAAIVGPLNEAVNEGIIPSHRLGNMNIKRDHVKRAEIIPLTAQQMNDITGYLGNLGIVAWLQYGAGLRASEALAVSRSWFRDNHSGKVLTVKGQRGENKAAGTVALKSRANGEYRDLPIPAWLWTKVTEHCAAHGEPNGDLVDASYSAYTQRLSMALKAAQVDQKFTSHHFRHLYASQLLGAGIPITTVSQWLGHRGVQVTSMVYAHLLPDAWESGREALDAMAV